MHLANYQQQRETLKRFALTAQGGTVFLTGKEEYGKSWLLEWLEADCRGSARVVRVDIDRPDFTATPTTVMNLWAQQLGWKHFEKFLAEKGRRSSGESAIKDTIVLGSYNKFSASSGSTYEDQLAISIELTSFFVEGVRSASRRGTPITICLDGCNGGHKLIESWVELCLIDSLLQDGSSRLVIAQRSPPDQRIVRRACQVEPIELGGVYDPHEWHRLAQELGRQLLGNCEDQIPRLEGIIDYAKGEPGGIMTYILGLPPQDAP